MVLASTGSPGGHGPLRSILASPSGPRDREVRNLIVTPATDPNVHHQAPSLCRGSWFYGIFWNLLNHPRKQALLLPLFYTNGGSERVEGIPEFMRPVC